MTIQISMVWYEVWLDASFDIPYILIIGQMEKNGDIVVIDPKEKDKIVFRSKVYEEAKLWLLEDEYTMVGERIAE